MRFKIFIKDEKGIALVTALILALVSMAIATATIYMVLQSTSISGLEKRYTTALGAAKGGAEVATKVITNAGTDPTGLLTINTSSNCLDQKLQLRKTDENGNNQWTNCTAQQRSLDVTESPDMTMTLGSGNNTYTVNIKIVDTIEGNTKLGSDLEVKGVVASLSGYIKNPTVVPRTYRTEIRSVNNSNAQDIAEVTALYAN